MNLLLSWCQRRHDKLLSRSDTFWDFAVSCPQTHCPVTTTFASRVARTRLVAVSVVDEEGIDENISAVAFESVLSACQSEAVIFTESNAHLVCHTTGNRYRNRGILEGTRFVVLVATTIA